MADNAPDPELLDVGGSPGRRPTRIVMAAVNLAALVLAGGAWSLDSRDRAHERAAVSACEAGLREASGLSERRMGLLADYVQPALRTTNGVQQLHLADLMAHRASGVLPAAERADRACRSVSVHPWHFSLVARRDAAVAYSGAMVTLLQTVAAQGSATFNNDAALVRLRLEAGVD
ncbi:MAG: hypothetical protein WAV00_24260 [Nocardioides sp.]